MVKISLFFDSSDHKYNPGDEINLEIRVQVNSVTIFRSIYTRIHGYAHVEWTESREVKDDDKSHTEHTTYSSHETYFKNYQTLAGSQAGPEIQLPVGLHVYHATFILPKRLPENYENNDYGHIRYEVKVQMDMPAGFAEKEILFFYLNPRCDLNEFPHLRGPVRAAAKKTFGCCCWKSDPLHIYNVLPCRGYVPGDHVEYSLEMNNDSNVPIKGAKVKLVEKIVFHALSPSGGISQIRNNFRTLWRHEFSGDNRQLVAAMQNKIFSAHLHFDPSWNFRFFDTCGIITVEHYFMSVAQTSGCHTNLSNYTTIKMGIIPFGGCGAIPMAPTMLLPSAPADFPSAPPAPITEQPLPSYNDTQFKPTNFIQATGIGWGGTGDTTSLETPPPTFTEAKFMDKKEKP